MDSLRKSFQRFLQVAWLGLLVVAVFGYLISGLSRPLEDSEQLPGGPLPGNSVASHSVSYVETNHDETGAPLGSATNDLNEAIGRYNLAWRHPIEEAGLKTANTADWLTVCRRLSLATVGSGLSLEELRALEQLPEGRREAAHLENLLNDSRFHHYWAERWTRFLVGTHEGEFVLYRRRRFRIWLTQTFAENWSYDRLVRTLITAEGLWTDRPEVNFFSATFDSNKGNPDPIRLAARTSRVFLGLRIDCLQCHDDFLGNVSLGNIDSPREGMQSDFHELAAFFGGATTSGLKGLCNAKVDYKYKYLDDDDETQVQPSVPYQEELLPPSGNARKRLATWITHPENRQAARAAVSHVWALMYGRSVGKAVDDLPLDQSLPDWFEVLVQDFIDSGFDMRRLVRLIAKSDAFRVDSRADHETLGGLVTLDHEQLGAVFPLVRLRPEQVAGSVIQAARVKKIDRESSLFLQFQTFSGINEFVQRYGDMGEDEFNLDNITITQRLLVMNGKLTRGLIATNPILNTTSHLEMFAADDLRLIEGLFLSALNRYPVPKEQQYFTNRLQESDNRNRAIEDIMWTLVNSSEMAWNH